MGNISINNLTAVHAGSNGTLTTVDVCNTPPFCTSIPYTNIAKSTDAAMTATSVFVNGNPICHSKSIFAISSGDEAGSCGGVVSGTIKGIAEFITFSPNVFIEGFPAVRQNDLMVSNMKNTAPAPLMQPGGGKPPELATQEPVELQESEVKQQLNVEIVGNAMHFLNTIVAVSEDDA